MDNFLKWAFAQELGTGEKLALVYLASQVGTAGVGRYDRDELAKVTDYEPRSLQRILKNLRDAGLLHDGLPGGWFSLGKALTVEDGQLPDPRALPLDLHPGAATSPGLSLEDVDAAGETIARHITEAANAHLTRLNDVGLRLLQGIEKIAQAAHVWETSVADAVAPLPPDPVRESVHFKVFSSSGFMNEDEAYDLARKRLDAEAIAQNGAAVASQARDLRKPDAPRGAVAAASAGAPAGGGRTYLDSALGRFERVRDVLDPEGLDPWADAMTVWQRMEDLENKHTVEGETDAFELLYPAIVTAARRHAGRMKLEAFLAAAPWDNVPAAAAHDSTVALQVELARMLDEIERAAHPMAQVGERTVEKGDDGVTRTENDTAYFTRVKRVHEQLKKLQQMGV